MYDKVKVKTWVDALRSGDYKQGADRLCRSDADGVISYCCLGVYSKVIDGNTDKYLMSGFTGPKSVYKHLGEVVGRDFRGKLSSRNDDLLEDGTHKYNFSSLADCIEKELL